MKSIYFALPFLFLLSSSSSSPSRVSHYNEQVLRFPYSETVLKVARELNLDVWGVTSRGIDIRVNSNERRQLGQRLGPQSLSGQILVENLQDLVEAQAEDIKSAPTGVTTGPEFHLNYHSYDDYLAWLKAIATKYSSLVTLQGSIGQSEEKRDIPMVKLNGSNKTPNKNSKKRIYIQGMQHAREWLAGSSALFLIDYFVSNYGKDATVTKLLDEFEFVILPICNPDGYQYTFTNDRYWRKNRGEGGDGVDLNRNWPDHWDGDGSSTDKDSEIYRGKAPASSVEVQALVKNYGTIPNVIAAVDLHTYGHLLLRPYGWRKEPSSDETKLKKGSELIRTAIRGVNGNDYESRLGYNLYQVNGGARDYFYGLGTKPGQQKPYSFTFEVTDGDFNLPTTEIVPTGNEVVKAVIALTNYARDNPLGVQKSQ